MVVPNSTCEVEAWSVFQLIVAEVLVIPEAVTDEITGGPTVADVVNVKLADVPTEAEELAESTAKS